MTMTERLAYSAEELGVIIAGLQAQASEREMPEENKLLLEKLLLAFSEQAVEGSNKSIFVDVDESQLGIIDQL